MNKLILFVKAPRPSFAKTRLAATLGADAAAAAYRSLVDQLVRQLAPLPDVELRFSPDDAEGETNQWLRSAWTSSPQGEGALGLRLQRSFAQAFENGATRVVVIGSDCPHVTPADIKEAWLLLARHDVVLGPATDGGYWLVGLRSHQPALFESIDWSTERVLAQTLRRADELRLSYKLLQEYADIDTGEAWRKHLASGAS